MPGTSHSVRSSLTWFSTNRGTLTVMPSRASPGACKYSARQSTPPKRRALGKACAVTLFALLELYKQGEATWLQEAPFSPITISAVEQVQRPYLIQGAA